MKRLRIRHSAGIVNLLVEGRVRVFVAVRGVDRVWNRVDDRMVARRVWDRVWAEARRLP